jgi:hypothetical protein
MFEDGQEYKGLYWDDVTKDFYRYNEWISVMRARKNEEKTNHNDKMSYTKGLQED